MKFLLLTVLIAFAYAALPDIKDLPKMDDILKELKDSNEKKTEMWGKFCNALEGIECERNAMCDRDAGSCKVKEKNDKPKDVEKEDIHEAACGQISEESVCRNLDLCYWSEKKCDSFTPKVPTMKDFKEKGCEKIPLAKCEGLTYCEKKADKCVAAEEKSENKESSIEKVAKTFCSEAKDKVAKCADLDNCRLEGDKCIPDTDIKDMPKDNEEMKKKMCEMAQEHGKCGEMSLFCKVEGSDCAVAKKPEMKDFKDKGCEQIPVEKCNKMTYCKKDGAKCVDSGDNSEPSLAKVAAKFCTEAKDDCAKMPKCEVKDKECVPTKDIDFFEPKTDAVTACKAIAKSDACIEPCEMDAGKCVPTKVAEDLQSLLNSEETKKTTVETVCGAATVELACLGPACEYKDGNCVPKVAAAAGEGGDGAKDADKSSSSILAVTMVAFMALFH